MLILPQFHVAGFMGISSYGLLNGLELHNVTKFNPNTFLQFIKERKVIIISAFNTLFKYFAQNCFTNTVFFHQYIFSSWRISTWFLPSWVSFSLGRNSIRKISTSWRPFYAALLLFPNQLSPRPKKDSAIISPSWQVQYIGLANRLLLKYKKILNFYILQPIINIVYEGFIEFN